MCTSTAKHVIILAHPGSTSFCRAIADHYAECVIEAGQHAVLRDLYAINFDPVLGAQERPGSADYKASAQVERELSVISGGDLFVLVYPVWFGGPPAILKGYVDRVLGANFAAHEVRVGARHPLLGGKSLLSFATSGTTSVWARDADHWLSSMHLAFETYVARVFGMTLQGHRDLTGIEGANARHAEECLQLVKATASNMCQMFETRMSIADVS